MSGETRELELLRWQFTLGSRLALHHLPHLTDEACFWSPAPGAWTARLGRDGARRPDWAEVEPDPAPAVTIAWLTWHVIWWLSDLMSAVRNEPQRTRQECVWPGSAAAAAARIETLLAS